MSEREPRKKSPFDEEKFKKWQESLEKYPLKRKLTNISFKGFLYFTVYLQYMTDPEFRQRVDETNALEILTKKEARTGFLEGSMIGNPLYVPSEDEFGMRPEKAPPGRYVGFDFRRPSEFGSPKKEKIKQTYQGKLVSFPLNELANNHPSRYTPTGYLEIFDVAHYLQIEYSNMDDLLSYGFVEQMNYRKAFKLSGYLGNYEQLLKERSIIDEPVYSITPKGNGLVFLVSDGGQKDKADDLRERVLNPVFGY